MSKLAEVLKQIESGRRAGTNRFFLITGNCQDDYPDPDRPDSPQLKPLTDLIAARYPNRLPLFLDLADGLTCPDCQQAAELVKAQAGGKEKKPRRKEGENSDTDSMLEQFRENMDQEEAREAGVLHPAWNEGLTMARQLFAASNRPILLFIPRLESLAPNSAGGADPSVRWAVDCLVKIASDRSLSRNQPLIVAMSRQAKALDSGLLTPDSRIRQLKLDLPDEDERRNTFSRLVADEKLCEEAEDVRQEREAMVTDLMSDTEGKLQESEGRLAELQDIAERAKADWESGRKDRQQQLQAALAQAKRQLAETQATETDSYQPKLAELRIKAEPWPLSVSRKNWLSIRPGDRLYLPGDTDRKSGNLRSHQVIDRTEGRKPGLVVSWVGRDNPMTVDNSLDGDPVIFRWRKGWLQGEYRIVEKLFRQTRNQDGETVREPAGEKVHEGWHSLAKHDGNSKPTEQPHWVPADRIEEYLEHREAADLVEELSEKAINDRFNALSLAEADLEEAEAALKAFRQSADDDPDRELVRIAKDLREQEGQVAELRTRLRALRDNDLASLPDDLDRRRLEAADSQMRSLLDGRFRKPLTVSLSEMARQSNGLRNHQLKALLATAEIRGCELTLDDICQLKLKMLNDTYGHLFQVIQPTYGFEGIGGLNHLKKAYGQLVENIRQGRHAAVPMGNLLMGPPGTGKTAIAEALAAECGFAFIELRNVRNMYVGETERQMEEIMDAVRSLAPVIVLRDEVDEEDSGRDSHQGDSGVSSRVRKAWMTFLSDPTIRGRVFVISCTNRPDRLDSALKRSGRTDWRVPLLLPDRDGLEAIFKVMFSPARYGFPCAVQDFVPYAESCSGLSGADVELIVTDANRLREAEGLDAVTGDVLDQAIDDFIPSADRKMIARMSEMACKNASHKQYLPPGWSVNEDGQVVKANGKGKLVEDLSDIVPGGLKAGDASQN